MHCRMLINLVPGEGLSFKKTIKIHSSELPVQSFEETTTTKMVKFTHIAPRVIFLGLVVGSAPQFIPT